MRHHQRRIAAAEPGTRKRYEVTQNKATNVVWHEGHVDRPQREALLKQQGVLIWLTGLPSSGKSTIAFTAEHMLVQQGRLAYVLDGDNIRHGLNKNLGFSAEDRAENIRRIGEVGKLFADAGLITLSSFVSPYRADRDAVRALMAPDEFIEVFVDTPVELCEERDPKGMYKKAHTGEIPNFTGVSDPYEAPTAAELVIKTAEGTPQDAATQIIQKLQELGKLTAPAA
jgi:adenylylsulfate kinase